MSDIALILDPADLTLDLALDGPDLKTDAGLQTAVLISLFTDAQANADDTIPDGSTDRRGWWGDAFTEVPGDKIGSLRWLLSRAKLTPETLRRVRDYDLAALKWLKDDGVAASIDITVTRHATDRDRADESIVITRPDGRISRFSYVWGTT